MVKLYEGGAYLVHGDRSGERKREGYCIDRQDSQQRGSKERHDGVFYSGSTQHFRRYGQIKNPFRCHDFP